jgi:NAD(P)-dependent dehydrogenase (short-subunit alcohol dehydrogenase family)
MIILITGGASGLGEAITRRLAAAPENTVYFTYSRSEKKAEEIQKELSNTVAVKCDFKEKADIKSLKEKIAQLSPDVLINNAYSGSFLKTYFHKIHADDFLAEFKENILPTISNTQAAINIFRKKKEGKIITILTSALTNTPPLGSSIYVSNKAYLAQLTKVWATENAKFNITSNAISPSMMETSFIELDERIVEEIKEQHPLKKMLTVEEVADTVHFLVHASPHINGANIVMNAATNII